MTIDNEPRRSYSFSDRLAEQEGSARSPGLWKIKDEVSLTVGAVLSLIGLIFLIVGIAATRSSEDARVGASWWLATFFCTGIFLVPAILLLRQGIIWRRRQKKLEDLAVFVKIRGQVTLEELAKAIQQNQVEALLQLQECREKGLIKGVLDRSGFIFTSSSVRDDETIK